MDLGSFYTKTPVKIFAAVMAMTFFYVSASAIYGNFQPTVAQTADIATNSSSNINQNITAVQATNGQSNQSGISVSDDNFNAEGSINSIILPESSGSSSSSNNTTGLTPTNDTALNPSNQTSASSSSDNQGLGNQSINRSPTQAYILGGKWRLDMVNKTVDYFKVNITMVTTAGTDLHHHLIVFNTNISSQQTSNSSAQNSTGSNTDMNKLLSVGKNSIFFFGTANIDTDSKDNWNKIPVSVSLFNSKVIAISVDSSKTNNYFSNMPIYGLVNSIEPLAPNTQSASTPQASAQQGTAPAGNTTGNSTGSGSNMTSPQ
jgi:hypothetical protein